MSEATATPEGQAPEGTEQTFTQADIDRIVSERLTRERNRYSDYDELKAKAEKLAEIEESERTELEKLTAKAEREAQARAALENELLRINVAMEQAPEGLDAAKIRKLASRLQGATREELEADAAEFFGDVAPSAPAETTSVVTQPKERLKPAPTGTVAPLNGDPLLRDVKAKLGIRE